MSMKQTPANVDAERATLGSALINREAIIAIAPWLPATSFYLEKHAWIYEAMLACYSARVPPDIRTVSDELRRQGRLDEVGGITYLADLVDSVPTSYHVEFYARIVEQCAVRRQLIDAAAKIAALAFDETEELEETIAAAQGQLNKATDRVIQGDLVPFSQIVDEEFKAFTNEEAVIGTATGLRDLDQQLNGGMMRQDLIILAARPSVGKSAFAGNIASNVAKAGGKVLLYSLEMDRNAWLQRHIAAATDINLAGIRSRELRDSELPVLMQQFGESARLPIYIDHSSTQTPLSLRNKTLRWIAQHGRPDLVVIDYLQLMNAGRKDGNKNLEIEEISRALKQLAREIDAPVLALSQLSRAVEGRTSHVPILSDLRHSGAIEQDADVVAFIHREELYDKDTDKKGIAEIHIAKHRNGPIGVVPLRFDASATRFSDLSYRTPEGY